MPPLEAAARRERGTVPLGKQHRDPLDVAHPGGVSPPLITEVRREEGVAVSAVVARVREHPYFRREGDDLYVEVPISITEAALGTTVEAPTLEGPRQVKVPPGSSSHRRLRLRGLGVQGAAGVDDVFDLVVDGFGSISRKQSPCFCG